jgi:hypothetical protein
MELFFSSGRFERMAQMRRIFPAVVLLMFNSWTATAMQQPPRRSQGTISDELRRLFQADQDQRVKLGLTAQGFTSSGSGKPEQIAELTAGDMERAKRIREVVTQEHLETINDFVYAATILLHNARSYAEDALTAHVLFTIVFKGSSLPNQPITVGTARYLAAVALDRYLQRTGHPQVFGTDPTQKVEPETISDATRSLYCVAPLTDTGRNELRNMSTRLENCPLR